MYYHGCVTATIDYVVAMSCFQGLITLPGLLMEHHKRSRYTTCRRQDSMHRYSALRQRRSSGVLRNGYLIMYTEVDSMQFRVLSRSLDGVWIVVRFLDGVRCSFGECWSEVRSDIDRIWGWDYHARLAVQYTRLLLGMFYGVYAGIITAQSKYVGQCYRAWRGPRWELHFEQAVRTRLHVGYRETFPMVEYWHYRLEIEFEN